MIPVYYNKFIMNIIKITFNLLQIDQNPLH
jgi:hypothetical protein